MDLGGFFDSSGTGWIYFFGVELDGSVDGDLHGGIDGESGCDWEVDLDGELEVEWEMSWLAIVMVIWFVI